VLGLRDTLRIESSTACRTVRGSASCQAQLLSALSRSRDTQRDASRDYRERKGHRLLLN